MRFSKLPGPAIAKKMAAVYRDPVTPSTDPGRFICNWTTYTSLAATEDDPNLFSLFW